MNSKGVLLNSASLAELEYTIDKLIVFHRQLITLLDEEYQLMTQANVPGLVETAQSKETVLAEIISHENLRMDIVDKFAVSAGLNPESVSLKDLADYAKNDKLRIARDTLVLLIESAREKNSRNMAFADQSLGRIEEMKKNVLGMNNNNGENYSDAGLRQPIDPRNQGGRLLSTEA